MPSNAGWNDEDGPLTLEPTVAERPAPAETRATDEIAELARVAQTLRPRDPEQLRARARRVGELLGARLDEKGRGTRAYYSIPYTTKEGSRTIEGPTVDLMDALAIEWGALLYSVRIVEQKGRAVKLRGRVVDLVSLVAIEREFLATLAPAPGRFEVDRWDAMQLQSAESKAVRGVLEHAIPAWLVDEAMTAARAAAHRARTGGRTLAQAVATAVEKFASLGVSAEALVDLVGRPVVDWSAYDLQTLRGVYEEVRTGVTTPASLTANAKRTAEPLRLEADAPQGTPGGSDV
jgi:hypothetical protein